MLQKDEPDGNATNNEESEHQETINFTSDMTVNPGNSFGDRDVDVSTTSDG